MHKENFSIPIVDKQKIGPEKKLPEKERQRKKERREKKDSLSQYILKWWKGDAHSHSRESTREGFGYTEGIYDIKEAMNYYQELGLEFACFTEHASKPGSPKKQSPESAISKSLLKEAERITEINKKLETEKELVALSGAEINIFYDKNKPSLDIPDEILQKLDLVIASRHAITKEKEPPAIKQSLLFAIENPTVDAIGHPDRYTRRGKKDAPEDWDKYWQEYWSIWPEILQAMIKNNKAFEINLNNPPSKKLVKMAAEKGVKFFINYDAHDFDQYKKEDSELIEKGKSAKRKWGRQDIDDDSLAILGEYKEQRLSSGPGYKAIRGLVEQIKRLESLNVDPNRVINSSKDRSLDFLTKERNKKTENLEYLTTQKTD